MPHGTIRPIPWSPCSTAAIRHRSYKFRANALLSSGRGRSTSRCVAACAVPPAIPHHWRADSRRDRGNCHIRCVNRVTTEGPVS
jgi:hypothetical protein